MFAIVIRLFPSFEINSDRSARATRQRKQNNSVVRSRRNLVRPNQVAGVGSRHVLGRFFLPVNDNQELTFITFLMNFDFLLESSAGCRYRKTWKAKKGHRYIKEIQTTFFFLFARPLRGADIRGPNTNSLDGPHRNIPVDQYVPGRVSRSALAHRRSGVLKRLNVRYYYYCFVFAKNRFVGWWKNADDNWCRFLNQGEVHKPHERNER